MKRPSFLPAKVGLGQFRRSFIGLVVLLMASAGVGGVFAFTSAGAATRADIPTAPAVTVSCTGIDVAGTNADANWSIIVELNGAYDPSTTVYLAPVPDGHINLATGNWTYDFRYNSNDIASDNITIPPCSSPTIAPTCGAIIVAGMPDGWKLVVEPGDNLFTTNGPQELGAGDYTYEFRDAQNNDITGGSITVPDCSTLLVTPTCTGITISGMPTGYYLVVEPGDHLFTPNGDYALSPGDYFGEFRDPAANDITGNNFTVPDCGTTTTTIPVCGTTTTTLNTAAIECPTTTTTAPTTTTVAPTTTTTAPPTTTTVAPTTTTTQPPPATTPVVHQQPVTAG